MCNLISAGDIVYNAIISPLLVTYVIAVVFIYMGFLELASASNNAIRILLTLYISEIQIF